MRRAAWFISMGEAGSSFLFACGVYTCIPCAVKWPLVLCQPFARGVLDTMLRRWTTLTPAVSSSFEWHHFAGHSALFSSSFRRHRDIVSEKQKRSAASLNVPEAYLTCGAKHRVIFTACFPEEHVDGSPEVFFSLVPARVQQ